jgi:hypothetical protein
MWWLKKILPQQEKIGDNTSAEPFSKISFFAEKQGKLGDNTSAKSLS